VYRWPTEDAVIQALTALQSPPRGIRHIRLVLFDESTRQAAERAEQRLRGPLTSPSSDEADGH
jgi:O-acetyl-ADP-ribose deacetylase